MYEQVAKDQVQERLKQGVSSQLTHRAIAQQKSSLSFSRRIVSWFTRHAIFKRPDSQIDPVQESGSVSLNSIEETS